MNSANDKTLAARKTKLFFKLMCDELESSKRFNDDINFQTLDYFTKILLHHLDETSPKDQDHINHEFECVIRGYKNELGGYVPAESFNCPRCSLRINHEYSYCPYCGIKLFLEGSREYEKELRYAL